MGDKMKNVYVVTYFDQKGKITISVFDDDKAAQEYYKYVIEEKMYVNVSIDCAPVYKNFYWSK